MDYIAVNEPLLDGNEKKYLCDCIDTGWISSEGKYVKILEENMAQLVNRKHGITVCNGSVAIDVAVEALQLQPGDEVIMPTFTIISCIAPLIRKGIKPVLVDSCLDTWNMDVNQIEKKITVKTKAIMIVHIYGLPVDVDSVMEIAKKYGLKVIEDAAEAHGLKYKGKMCGGFGDISTMSFYANKHVTTGEGGIVMTNNDFYADRSRSFRNLCMKPERRFVHDELGYNFRMSNIQAAVGVAQLECLEQHLNRKKRLGLKYLSLLHDNKIFQLPMDKIDYADNIYWVFGLVIRDEYDFNATEIINYLAKKNIGCRPFFYPMHLQPVLRKMGLFENEVYPIAEKLMRKGFYIPSGLGTTDVQLEYVAEVLNNLPV